MRQQPARRNPGGPGWPVALRTPAKINLGLFVQSKRSDGYHQIRTVLASISLWDTLRFEPTEGGGVRLRCEEPGIPTDDSNLVLRAAALLGEGVPGGLPGVRIRLRKRIPAGRGLGGGSSDAAAALVGLNRCFGLGLSRAALHRSAARIGMDVPFFLYGGLALATGRGDQVFPLPDGPEVEIVLLIPSFEIPTGDAYRLLPESAALTPQDHETDGGTDGIARIWPLMGPGSPEGRFAPEMLTGRFANDLEQSEVLRETRTSDALFEMRRALTAVGAVETAMSGSGSAVFGVFRDREAAETAAARLSGDSFRAVATRTISRAEHRAAIFGEEALHGAWPRG